MKKLDCLFLLLVITTQILAQSTIEEIVNRFSRDVYHELSKTQKGNFAVSPVSAQIVTSLALLGARSQTADELAAALHLPLTDITKLRNIVAKLTWKLQGSNKYSLDGANKIYIEQGYRVKESFTNITQENKVEVDNIDFLKGSAVEEINKWVAKQTQGKINNLLSRHHVDSGTKSLFVSALFFNGTWKYPFLKGKTRRNLFYVDSKIRKETDMMCNSAHYRFYESPDRDAKFLEMPFYGRDVTMTVVLPNNKDSDLSSLEKIISGGFATPKYAKYAKIHVEIPRFTIESTVQFEDILQQLGARKAFTDSAEISEIVEGQRLKIERVVQKVFLEVQEAGVTTLKKYPIVSTIDLPKHRFIANHPFLYYIKLGDIVLFIGRYVSP